MKISLGFISRDEPWGGANQFAKALERKFAERRIEVRRDLKDPDLDFVLLGKHTRKRQLTPFSDRDVMAYLRHGNPRAIVIHRVNDCDERKETNEVNRRMIDANLCADHTVFISGWLRNLYFGQGMRCRSHSVIWNGSDPEIFNSTGHRPWDRSGPMKLVTHHWSAHPMKGFDIYTKLDRMLGTPKYKNRIEFSFIGRIPATLRFENALHIPATQGVELADLLRSHHVYLTASMLEPCGNHQIEGATCGLPVLFRNSGGIPETCRGFGIEFEDSNFEARLDEMIDQYERWQARMADFPHTSDRMAKDYCGLLLDLDARREEILASRALGRRLRWQWRDLIAGRSSSRGEPQSQSE